MSSTGAAGKSGIPLAMLSQPGKQKIKYRPEKKQLNI